MKNDSHYGSYGSYMAGFACSIALTFAAFFTVSQFAQSQLTMPIVVMLAVFQLVVQLTLFLHLSGHPRARWNLASFIFTSFMLLFVVIGTLWIMNHLNQNMTPGQIDAYMHKQN